MTSSAPAPPEPDFPLSPVGCLSLLWPAVDECLVSTADRGRLEADAAKLAPVPRVALEIRLGERDHGVDLHQLFTAWDADAGNLKRALHSADQAAVRDSAIGRFLAAWADDADGLRTSIETIYLEWDRPGDGAAPGAPAIFLPVQRRVDQAGVADQRHRILEYIERHGLGGPEGGRLISTIFHSIPETLSISFIGLMAGRADAVRINLRQIRPDDLAGVLARIEWPGDVAIATDHFRRLVERTGQVGVALDYAPHLLGTIGYEALLDGLPEIEPRWGGVFDELKETGLCAPQKAAALLAAGVFRYPEDPEQLWPTAWMAATAMSPERFTPWLEQRVSHAKVSISAAGVASAKAYLSAQHFWSRGGRDSPPLHRASHGGEDLDAARDRAGRFLLAHRSQDDLWRDFQIVNGMSDEWVTAFIGCALAGGGGRVSCDILRQTATALVRRQRADGGWGYNAHSPADADSTAWALEFLGMISWAGPEAEAGLAFLRSHLLPDGGFATYRAETKVRFGDGRLHVDDRGWRGSHLCVAANAARLLEGTLSDLLVSSQAAEGCWNAYWWRRDAFATAMAVEALPPDADRSRRSAVAWARAQQTPSVFDRAWLARILLHGDPDDQIRAQSLARELARQQREDGGWDASAEMLFPDPSTDRREPDAATCPDHRRLFTAASVMMALDHVLRAGGPHDVS